VLRLHLLLARPQHGGHSSHVFEHLFFLHFLHKKLKLKVTD
jgi:hypothetical protein